MGGERVEEIRIVDVDQEIQPDNSFRNAHAIYLILSDEPSDRWIKEFEHVCRLRVATRGRTITVVGSRLRVVVSPSEHLTSVLQPIHEAIQMTNERLGRI